MTENGSPIGSRQSGPTISGDIVVWHDDRNGTWDIYAYDLSTHGEFAVCTGESDQEWPVISDQLVVWLDAGSGNYDLYGAYIPEPTGLLLLGLGGLALNRLRSRC